jgi:hypothetical protein
LGVDTELLFWKQTYVASTEEDGAFFVYLEDVDEPGVVRYLTEALLRGIHRKLSDEMPPYVTSMPSHTFKRADAMPLPRGEKEKSELECMASTCGSSPCPNDWCLDAISYLQTDYLVREGTLGCHSE